MLKEAFKRRWWENRTTGHGGEGGVQRQQRTERCIPIRPGNGKGEGNRDKEKCGSELSELVGLLIMPVSSSLALPARFDLAIDASFAAHQEEGMGSHTSWQEHI